MAVDPETPAVGYRRLNPIIAFLAGIVWLGYVYVGRMRAALMLLGVVLGLSALFSWTRWILNPAALYVLVAAMLGAYLLAIVHPVVIAVRTPGARRTAYNRWWFYLAWLIVSGGLSQALALNRGAIFGYETFRIPSASMAPTLDNGDFILVDSWRYRETEPVAGEIIVYLEPSGAGVNYVKRIVGLPGDMVEMRGGRLLRNGEPAPETYLEPALRIGGADAPAARLAPGEYFVLGDNRSNSRDSRYHGPVPRANIVGRVEYIWFPVGSSL
jgi:signal peptidase I